MTTPAPAAPVAFDVGAHLGEDSAFYLALGYSVVAIEANPQLVDHLRHRFAEEAAAGRFAVEAVAVGPTTGVVRFFVNESLSVWGTTDPRWAERNRVMGAPSVEIEVPCRPFGDLVGRHGCPTVLKIDVEGADLDCLVGLSSGPCRPAHVSIESSKTGWRQIVAEFDALEALGYRRYRVVRQGRAASHDGEFVGLDGRRVSHHFEDDASGPFGPHLEGAWLTRRQALWRYWWINLGYRVAGDTTWLRRRFGATRGLRRHFARVGWYDTHAVRDDAAPALDR